MRLGLIDMIGLAASLIFAIPLGIFGATQLFAGEVALGVALLGVAAAMVVLPQYFLDPGRILRGLLVGLLPRQLRGLVSLDPADESSNTADSTEEDQTEATPEDATAVEK